MRFNGITNDVLLFAGTLESLGQGSLECFDFDIDHIYLLFELNKSDGELLRYFVIHFFDNLDHCFNILNLFEIALSPCVVTIDLFLHKYNILNAPNCAVNRIFHHCRGFLTTAQNWFNVLRQFAWNLFPKEPNFCFQVFFDVMHVN